MTINPIIQEITVLDPDGPRKSIGWTFHEITDEEIAERDSKENLEKLKQEREATDKADKYKSYYSVSVDIPNAISFCTVEVLPQLKGKSWNNAALNWIHSLRPSSIRVTQGEITLDARTWRVTVYLEKDNKTIKKIEQEVEVGLDGFRNGSDAKAYLNNSERLNQAQSNCSINLNALSKLEIKNK